MADRETIRIETLKAIDAASSSKELEAIRVAALGKKGAISALLAELSSLPIEQRKIEGAANNELKSVISERLEQKFAELNEKALNAQLKQEAVDVTLPVRLPGIETGRIHPISQVVYRLLQWPALLTERAHPRVL